MERLPKNANNINDVAQYYITRAKQMAQANVQWSQQLVPLKDYGVRTFFTKDNERFQSIYIYEQSRGKGNIDLALAECNLPIITVNDCDIIPFLQSRQLPHYVVKGVFDSDEYRAIEEVYDDHKAKRSQVFLMNHIDEGLTILSEINASELAKRAYCLHPLLQDNESLLKNYRMVTKQFSADVVLLALEYRNIANAFLSQRITDQMLTDDITTVADLIKLSPLTEVNQMLVADKVQNFKDFIEHHYGKHERSSHLNMYFSAWLVKLGITDKEFKRLCKLIN